MKKYYLIVIIALVFASCTATNKADKTTRGCFNSEKHDKTRFKG